MALSYPGTSRVKNTNPAVADYQYDANGNTILSNTKPAGISYDPYFNLPGAILDGNSEQTTFKYGGSGERVARITMGGQPEKTFYIRGLSEYPLVEYDNGSANTRLYVYGKNGIIAVQENNYWYFAIRDHLGSTPVLVNQSNAAEGYKYFTLRGNGSFGRVDVDSRTVMYEDPETNDQYEVKVRVDNRWYYVQDSRGDKHLGSNRVTIDSTGTVLNALDYYAFGELLRSYNLSTPNDRYKFMPKALRLGSAGKERDTDTDLDFPNGIPMRVQGITPPGLVFG